jgi:hypothetical protein
VQRQVRCFATDYPLDCGRERKLLTRGEVTVEIDQPPDGVLAGWRRELNYRDTGRASPWDSRMLNED